MPLGSAFQTHSSLLHGCTVLPSISFKKLSAMVTSLSNNDLLHLKSHSHPESVWAPSCCMTWLCWLEMEYSLGYFATKDMSSLIQLSSQNFILSPQPTLHDNPFWKALASCWWWRACFRSRHQMESVWSEDATFKLLQPPYFDSSTFAHKSPLW